MDKLEAMSALLAAVEAGSLSAASRKLGMPLATVSRKVSELETHLRTRLVNRTSRRLVLTEAGRSYVAAAKRILEDIGEAERAATGEYSTPKGELLITAPIVFGRLHVLPIVLQFLKTYPEIDVRFTLADRVINLQEEQVDLAVRIGELPDSSLVATRVGSIGRVVCGSPSYFAEHGTPRTPGELSKYECITFNGLTSPEEWIFPSGKRNISVSVHSRLIVNTAEVAIDAAIAGLAITRVLSYQVADAVRTGSLVFVLRDFEPPAAPVSIVYPNQGLIPLKLRAFLDFAVPRLKARL